MNKYSVVLPAYNEADNITRVLTMLSKVNRINEIVVVDDGSIDGTKTKVGGFIKARLVVNRKNLGKTRSVQKGVLVARNENLIFFDADLLGVRLIDIKKMLDMFESGVDMVIMDKGSQAYLMREVIKCVPALSGARVLKKQDFGKIRFKDSDKFELEMRINDYFIENNLKILISPAPYVRDVRKYRKYSFFKGVYLDMKAISEVFLMYGWVGSLDLFKKFRIFYEMKG